MYKDNDHLMDDLNIYTVKGNWNEKTDQLLAKPIYRRKSKSDHYRKIVDLRGPKGENFVKLIPSSMYHVDAWCGLNGILKEKSVWGRMARGLIEIGIKSESIGIFGSRRLGLPSCKDVDFVLYGRESFQILKDRIDDFKSTAGLYNQTTTHARYQSEAHGSNYDPEVNSLERCLLNKWSTCAVEEDLTSTIRFVDPLQDTSGLLKLIWNLKPAPRRTIVGSVSEADGASFIPRTFKLMDYSGNQFQVVSHLWIFHQCVRENDLVAVTGIVDGNRVFVRDYDHGIKHL